MTIRKNVEYLLKQRKMTKVELAEEMQTSLPNLTRYLDASNIGLKAICKIAKLLDAKPADLLASPPLSDRNKPKHDEEETIQPKQPTKTSFICPECGTKLRVTIEPFEEQR